VNIFGLSFNCVYWDAVGWGLILNSPKSTVHYGGEYYAGLKSTCKTNLGQRLWYFCSTLLNHVTILKAPNEGSPPLTESLSILHELFHADVNTSLMNFTQLPFPWDIQQCLLEGFLDNALDKAHANQFSIIHILWGYWQLLYQ